MPKNWFAHSSYVVASFVSQQPLRYCHSTLLTHVDHHPHSSLICIIIIPFWIWVLICFFVACYMQIHTNSISLRFLRVVLICVTKNLFSCLIYVFFCLQNSTMMIDKSLVFNSLIFLPFSLFNFFADQSEIQWDIFVYFHISFGSCALVSNQFGCWERKKSKAKPDMIKACIKSCYVFNFD